MCSLVFCGLRCSNYSNNNNNNNINNNNEQMEQYQQTDLISIKKEKTCLLIDIAIPDDSNANTKETEKLSKQRPGDREVSRMWKVRT